MTVSVARIEKLLAEETERRSLELALLAYNREDREILAEAVNALPALIAAVKALRRVRPYVLMTEYQVAHGDCQRVADEALAPFSFEEQA